MNPACLTLLLMLFTSVISVHDLHSQETNLSNGYQDDKIKVLNLGTFHMGRTSDSITVAFDERSEKNKQEVHQIARKIAEFKPTVIVVETPPSYDSTLQLQYQNYRRDPTMTFEYPSEIELLAFELGRICNVDRIYGIDHKMEYDYQKIGRLAEELNKQTYLTFMKNLGKFMGPAYEEASTLEKLRMGNSDEFLDWLIVGNADILTHVSTESGYEGADEAAKFYRRNLRMYSNLNKLSLSRSDRVFLLMGTSHTAFFRDFMSRSPRYQMVNTLEYLE